jgi:hypothetical protein
MFNQTKQVQNALVSNGQMPVNVPVTPVSFSPDVDHVSAEEYSNVSNLLVQIIAALNNLRDKNYDLIDAVYNLKILVEKDIRFLGMLPKITDGRRVFEYAQARYKESLGDIPEDVSLSEIITEYLQAIDLLMTSADFSEYRVNSNAVQLASDSLSAMITFLIDDYSNRLKDIELDVKVGDHGDDVSDLMPERLKSLVNSERDINAYNTRQAIKADRFAGVIAGLGKFTKALNASRIIIGKFQSVQAVLVKQIQALIEQQDKAQVDKYKQRLKDLIADFQGDMELDWANLVNIWATIDSPDSPINDVDAGTARHIRKYLSTPLPPRPDSIAAAYRDITRWNEYLLAGVVKAKQNGGTQDQRSKWYIGNGKVVDDLGAFKALLEKSSAANAAKPDAPDNGEAGISLKVLERLGQYIHILAKFTASDIAMDLARGEKWVQDSLSKSKLMWSQITSLHDSYNSSKGLVTGNKPFDKLFETLDDAYNKLLATTDEKGRFLQVKRIIDTAPLAIDAIDAITVKGNATPTDQNLYSGNVSLVQTSWRDLAKTYSEMLKLAPNNVGMQLDYTIENPPELSGRYVTKFNSWYGTLIKLVDQLLEFAVFYTRVKSLYPLTIGMRAFGSPNGKDIENVKYIESMGALLSEALAGKSLSAAKTALLRQALVIYPEDNKVLVANKMYDIARSENQNEYDND